jgi:hypothetical protein
MALPTRRRSRPINIVPEGAPASSEPGFSVAAARRADAAIDRSIQTGQPIPDASVIDENYNEEVGAVTGAPATRIDQLGQDGEIRKEYRLRMLHRMMMRQLTVDTISKALGVSVRQVYYMREELRRQLRTEAVERDLPSYIGMTDAFYNEVIGMAMREASQRGAAAMVKLASLKVAMQAQRDRTQLYEASGFFSALRLTPQAGSDDTRSHQADKLVEMSKNLMDVFEMSDEEWEERENAPLAADKVFLRPDERGDEDRIRARVL